MAEINSVRACLALPKPAILGLLLMLAGCGAFNDQPTDSASGTPQDRPIPGQGAVGLRLARAARQAGDLPGAIQLYRNLVDSETAAPQTLVEFGDTLAAAGMPDDAIEAYGRVDRKSPAGLPALLGLVRAHVTLGDPAAALQVADEAAAIAPQDVRMLVDRGAALDGLQRHAEAQAAYRAALQHAPRNVAARNNLALSLAISGQYDEAVAIMAPLARSSTATPRIRENLALIYGLSGNTERATAMSRVDLDESGTTANLAFFAWVRDSRP